MIKLYTAARLRAAAGASCRRRETSPASVGIVFFSTQQCRNVPSSFSDFHPVTRFSEEERLVQESASSFAKNELKPLVRQMDEQQQIDSKVISRLFSNGFMALEIPEEHDGASLSFTSACLTIEELSRVDPSVAVMVDVHNTLVVNAIRFWGSKMLQKKYLPKLSSGCIGAFCLSEAQSGSDAFALRTSAQVSEDGSYYTINGTKLWITSAREAGAFVVFATVNPSLSYKGITAFVIDADTPGIIVGNPESKLGLKASSTCPVTFDNVKVDADNILGKVGEGYKYCIEILNEGRIGIAAQQVGIAKGCMDIVLPYLHEREQFGQKLVNMPMMQSQYAQAAAEIHAAEVMLYNACRMKESGLPFVKEASICKLYSSQVAERTASKSIEWLGGIGFTTDLLAEKFYRDCKVGSIYEGTSNIQLQTIAKIVSDEYA
jgi:short/branched chain acyl-CoA dehydrogenase